MTVPASWMPNASMQRIVCHWSAGAHDASWLDRKHYHFIIEGDGNLVRGDRSVSDNAAPIRGAYAAHTRNCNTGSIGVSMACMAGAVERPFDAGRYPMTRPQWDAFVATVADLCQRYGIKVTPKTVLSHAEVQSNLGIAQRGKWDFTRLPPFPDLVGAKVCGDFMRASVQQILAGEGPKPKPVEEPVEADQGEPEAMELRGVVTAGWLNFRRSPMGDIIGGLPRGTAIAVIDRDEGWYQARSPGGYLGWVSGRYVDIV
ncbi:N-acetylmuramoyl-L-alanine amidase [Aurantimonas sp. A2-1-M11]|uniref:N-acetylmuramoyl-L-alanine amidase n=1 Tax=Aurantimonas sp. A2-1-M11 TaxID=3113712 RepID=UPI002F93D15D